MPRVTMWGWQSLLGADSVCLPNHPIICLEHPHTEQIEFRPNTKAQPDFQPLGWVVEEE